MVPNISSISIGTKNCPFIVLDKNNDHGIGIGVDKDANAKVSKGFLLKKERKEAVKGEEEKNEVYTEECNTAMPTKKDFFSGSPHGSVKLFGTQTDWRNTQQKKEQGIEGLFQNGLSKQKQHNKASDKLLEIDSRVKLLKECEGINLETERQTRNEGVDTNAETNRLEQSRCNLQLSTKKNRL